MLLAPLLLFFFSSVSFLRTTNAEVVMFQAEPPPAAGGPPYQLFLQAPPVEGKDGVEGKTKSGILSVHYQLETDTIRLEFTPQAEPPPASPQGDGVVVVRVDSIYSRTLVIIEWVQKANLKKTTGRLTVLDLHFDYNRAFADALLLDFHPKGGEWRTEWGFLRKYASAELPGGYAYYAEKDVAPSTSEGRPIPRRTLLELEGTPKQIAKAHSFLDELISTHLHYVYVKVVNKSLGIFFKLNQPNAPVHFYLGNEGGEVVFYKYGVSTSEDVQLDLATEELDTLIVLDWRNAGTKYPVGLRLEHSNNDGWKLVYGPLKLVRRLEHSPVNNEMSDTFEVVHYRSDGMRELLGSSNASLKDLLRKLDVEVVDGMGKVNAVTSSLVRLGNGRVLIRGVPAPHLPLPFVLFLESPPSSGTSEGGVARSGFLLVRYSLEKDTVHVEFTPHARSADEELNCQVVGYGPTLVTIQGVREKDPTKLAGHIVVLDLNYDTSEEKWKWDWGFLHKYGSKDHPKGYAYYLEKEEDLPPNEETTTSITTAKIERSVVKLEGTQQQIAEAHSYLDAQISQRRHIYMEVDDDKKLSFFYNSKDGRFEIARFLVWPYVSEEGRRVQFSVVPRAGSHSDEEPKVTLTEERIDTLIVVGWTIGGKTHALGLRLQHHSTSKDNINYVSKTTSTNQSNWDLVCGPLKLVRHREVFEVVHYRSDGVQELLGSRNTELIDLLHKLDANGVVDGMENVNADANSTGA